MPLDALFEKLKNDKPLTALLEKLKIIPYDSSPSTHTLLKDIVNDFCTNHYSTAADLVSQSYTNLQNEVMDILASRTLPAESHYLLSMKTSAPAPATNEAHLQKAAAQGHLEAMRLVAGKALSGQYRDIDHSIPWALHSIRYLETIGLSDLKKQIQDNRAKGMDVQKDEKLVDELEKGIIRARCRIIGLEVGEPIPDPINPNEQKRFEELVKQTQKELNEKGNIRRLAFSLNTDMFTNLFVKASPATQNNKAYSAPSAHYSNFVLTITAQSNAKKFEEKMSAFFSTPTPLVKLKPLQQMDDALENNIVIGETHDDPSPKHFLIQNMAKLKAAGYRTLFIEHLYYEDQVKMDTYQNHGNATTKAFMPHRVTAMDSMFSGNRSKNTFADLIEVATAHGIRVVGLDTEYTYQEQSSHKHVEYEHGGSTGRPLDDYRTKSFNYTASKIIEKESQDHQGKWIALIGNSHAKTYHGIPGICDLAGARHVLVRTKREDEKSMPITSFNGEFIAQQKTRLSGGTIETVIIPFDARIQVEHSDHPMPQFGTSKETARPLVEPVPITHKPSPSLTTPPARNGLQNTSKPLPGHSQATRTPRPRTQQPKQVVPPDTTLSSTFLLQILAHPAAKIVTAILALAGLACIIAGSCGLAGVAAIPLLASAVLVGVGTSAALVGGLGFFKSGPTQEPVASQTAIPR